jgi:hypothetical protein
MYSTTQAQALRWYLREAEQGDVAAMYNLAVSYEEGDGVARDPAMAFTWYSRAGPARSTSTARVFLEQVQAGRREGLRAGAERPGALLPVRPACSRRCGRHGRVQSQVRVRGGG